MGTVRPGVASFACTRGEMRGRVIGMQGNWAQREREEPKNGMRLSKGDGSTKENSLLEGAVSKAGEMSEEGLKSGLHAR